MTNYEDQSHWRASQNGSDFCHFKDLQESSRSQLQQENKFTTVIDNHRYTVKEYDGKWLVFRRDLGDIARIPKRSYDRNYTTPRSNIEIKLFTLDEANEHLSDSQNSFELFGSDPVKIVNDEIKVVMVKTL
jgi:hypothetical protein